MLIGYSMPAVTNVALSAGTWLTADAGAACVDGKPARRARYSAAGAATITLTLAAAVPIRVAAMLGLRGVAAGTAVSVTAASGTVNGTVQAFADGSFGCWFVLPEGAAGNSVAFQIGAGGTIDVGELVAMPAVDVAHESDWTDAVVDPSLSVLTLGAQRATVPRKAYRTFDGVLSADGVSPVRGGGLANGMDWEQLRTALLADARCVGIPRWQLPSGAVDAVALHRSALYATGRISGIAHLGGDFYSGAIALQEVPA